MIIIPSACYHADRNMAYQVIHLQARSIPQPHRELQLNIKDPCCASQNILMVPVTAALCLPSDLFFEKLIIPYDPLRLP
jgi:hypothetical protein